MSEYVAPTQSEIGIILRAARLTPTSAGALCGLLPRQVDNYDNGNKKVPFQVLYTLIGRSLGIEITQENWRDQVRLRITRSGLTDGYVGPTRQELINLLANLKVSPSAAGELCGISKDRFIGYADGPQKMPFSVLYVLVNRASGESITPTGWRGEIYELIQEAGQESDYSPPTGQELHQLLVSFIVNVVHAAGFMEIDPLQVRKYLDDDDRMPFSELYTLVSRAKGLSVTPADWRAEVYAFIHS